MGLLPYFSSQNFFNFILIDSEMLKQKRWLKTQYHSILSLPFLLIRYFKRFIRIIFHVEIYRCKFSEEMKQLIANKSNGNELAMNDDDVIIFPRQLKWKLINDAQRIELRNPTENRFAIKVLILSFLIVSACD